MGEQQLYLASRSPRRAELLAQVGIGFQVLAVDVDETPDEGEAPADYVRRMARVKAAAGRERMHSAGLAPLPVLGADTTVVVDGHIVGKPRDRDDGLHMLARLSGRCHQVMTAVCLCFEDFEQVAVSVSEVCFRPLEAGEGERYWATGEPADKAGGYAIQGRAAVFVSALHGSYSGVVGLPLMETWQLLEACAAWRRAGGHTD